MKEQQAKTVRTWLVGVICATGIQSSWAATAVMDFSDLVEKNAKAVVNISASTKAKKRNAQQLQQQQVPDIFRHFFGDQFDFSPQQQNKQSFGSGFIISKEGYVLTNNHVVDHADKVIVKLNDRREVEAEVIGTDERTDVALLKIKADNLPVVEIGNPDKLKVGQPVLAIGSPFGFDYSATAGIVSAKSRALPNESYVPFIQTDVAINPGNSGGLRAQAGAYARLALAVLDPLEGRERRLVIRHLLQQIAVELDGSRDVVEPLLHPDLDLSHSFPCDTYHPADLFKCGGGQR